MTNFLVLLFAYTLSQFFRTFLAVIAPELSRELALGADGLANMSAAWFITFAMAQIPIGLALDRIGPRRIVPALMMLAVAGAVMLAQARNGFDCIVANGLIGLGCSPIYMGALYVFARTAAPERFGFLTAAMLGLGSSGNLLAATPLALATEAFGWRASFYGIAAIVFVAAIAVMALVRDPVRAPRPDNAASALSELVQVISMRSVWPLLPLTMLGYGTVLAARGLWVGPYFAEIHALDPIARGNATLAMAVAMSAGALIYGALDGGLARRRMLIIGGSLITASCFLGLWLMPQPPLWIAVSLLTVAGCAGLSHPLLVAHARAFFPDHLVGRGITLANFVSIGGAGLLQWLSGIYVTGLQGSGVAPAGVFAALYLAFGLAIVVAATIYAVGATDPAKVRG